MGPSGKPQKPYPAPQPCSAFLFSTDVSPSFTLIQKGSKKDQRAQNPLLLERECVPHSINSNSIAYPLKYDDPGSPATV